MLESAALAVLNHLLQDAPWARTRLVPYAGRVARLSLPPWRLDLAVGAQGQLARAAAEAPPDVEISLPAGAFLQLLGGPEQAARAVRVSGSAEFADALGFVLRKLRWDFEEDLARRIGDIPAHRIAGLVSGFATWQRQAARKLAENVAEYLTEESPTLAKPTEVADFVAGVDGLRDDLARLEKRLARLAP